MLTFNSGATLARALTSVADVAEVVIADGGSTDDTVEVARRYGRTVVRQDPSTQDGSGRLIDYGAAREQLRQLATQPWILELDSDEYASLGLVDELRRVCESAPAGPNVYNVPARYEVDGAIVDCATTYPMQFPQALPQGRVQWLCRSHTREGRGVRRYGGTHMVVRDPLPACAGSGAQVGALSTAGRGEARTFAPEVVLARYRHQQSQLRWFVRDLWTKQVRATCQHRLPVRYEVLRGAFYVARYLVFARERVRRRVGRHQPPDQVTVD